MRYFENLDRRNYIGEGAFDIPALPSVADCPDMEWIPFNFVKSRNASRNVGVHFFIDDYQFTRIWDKPDIYADMLANFGIITAPDFSTYTDMPKALQIYNHYRKHWIARYFSERGITVIPTISWSTPDSFEWCFDGEPTGSVVAISCVGCRKGSSRELFFAGFEEMKRRLRPSAILCYGSEMAGCVNIPPYYAKIKEARENGRKRGEHGGKALDKIPKK